MMDYIALLLEEQPLRPEEDTAALEAERRSTVLTWEPAERGAGAHGGEPVFSETGGPIPAPEDQGETGDREMPETEEKPERAPRAESTGGAELLLKQTAGDPLWPAAGWRQSVGDSEPTAEGGGGDSADAAPVLQRTGNGGGAAWADRVVRASLASLPEPLSAGTAAQSTDPIRTWTGAGRVEELDRVFRRDARRYDGGFSLL